MSETSFFYFTLFIGGFFIGIFFWKKKAIPDPTLLNLKIDNKKNGIQKSFDNKFMQDEAKESQNGKSFSDKSFSEKNSFKKSFFSEEFSEEFAESGTFSSPQKEKNLNVIFMWNGETWDAYEILGLPAGSRWPQVEAAYEKIKREASPDALPFYYAAYEAIKSLKNN